MELCTSVKMSFTFLLLTLVSVNYVRGGKVSRSMMETGTGVSGSGRGDYFPHGHSQDYHYNSHAQHGGGFGGFGGFPFDMTTGAIFLFLIFGAMCYPFFTGGHGSGYGRRSLGDWASHPINLTDLSSTAEKVLTAVEKAYTAYSKNQ